MTDMEQFPELELTKEDHDQIFEPPTDRQQPQNQHEPPYRYVKRVTALLDGPQHSPLDSLQSRIICIFFNIAS